MRRNRFGPTLATGKLSFMTEPMPSSLPTTPNPRWYAPTPAKFLFAVLAMQGVLFLSGYYRWFWFNERKG